ncbi:MAG: hypothetical protein ACK5LC_15755 [Coprobacillaceae bacterium]
MSWENDSGILIFMGILIVFIIFCAFMAVCSNKKQKQRIEEGYETYNDQQQRNTRNSNLFGIGFVIFLGIIWLSSAILMLVLYSGDNMYVTFSIPRFMSLPYDALGITAGAIVQILISGCIIIGGIRSFIKAVRR